MTTIPTLRQLYTSILGDLQTEFGVIINPIGKAYLRGFAAVQAAKLKLSYLALGNVQKNVWPDTADTEANGGTLERFGRTKNIVRFSATQGLYNMGVTGTAGSVIPASFTYKSDDTSLNPGFLFVLDNAYTLTGTDDVIGLRALTAGTAALLAVNNTLTGTAPIVGVGPGATVMAITSSPVDGETDSELRARILETYLLEPQGGAAADYRIWGRTVAGVAQIYPYAVDGQSNTVATYVEAILSDSTDGKGTPSTTILNNVTAVYAPDNGLIPLAVFAVNVLPVVIQTVDIAISGTMGALTAAQKTLITNALTQAVALIRPFIPGADVLANRNDVLSVNIIVTVILSTVPGIAFAAPVLTITAPGGGGVSVSSYTFDEGNIPFLNSVSFS